MKSHVMGLHYGLCQCPDCQPEKPVKHRDVVSVTRYDRRISTTVPTRRRPDSAWLFGDRHGESFTTSGPRDLSFGEVPHYTRTEPRKWVDSFYDKKKGRVVYVMASVGSRRAAWCDGPATKAYADKYLWKANEMGTARPKQSHVRMDQPEGFLSAEDGRSARTSADRLTVQAFIDEMRKPLTKQEKANLRRAGFKPVIVQTIPSTLPKDWTWTPTPALAHPIAEVRTVARRMDPPKHHRPHVVVRDARYPVTTRMSKMHQVAALRAVAQSKPVRARYKDWEQSYYEDTRAA